MTREEHMKLTGKLREDVSSALKNGIGDFWDGKKFSVTEMQPSDASLRRDGEYSNISVLVTVRRIKSP